MSFTAFIVFVILALYVIWRKKTPARKKQWVYTILKLLAVYIVATILSLLFYSLENYFFVIPQGAGDHYTGVALLSLATLCGVYFINVGLPSLFSGIMRFHKAYNKDNYDKLKNIAFNTSTALLLSLRVILSLSVVIIYYGIWLG
ncbi:hypothetical protein SMZ82_003272 [Cronobacter malonaticus]|uniref:hypothetical protein n=1 Tax=Cronobacter TaxID=413496 RepID=UPI000A4B7D5A|nr:MULTISPECIES: hypothetical protein [Cronobacter]ELY2514582.1 hypothetical protein [Cronobacter malonaticus]ELY4583930.1 hypothetical protein [Cronobacter malonaticus]ELY4806657.1 hypothetical protein [Cronobacter malonaticus]ELY5935743.1 hypothetical protein [Cronobacter malonaticus]MDI6406443.1 hypothetical protein [Cronobacter malonaticus]